MRLRRSVVSRPGLRRRRRGKGFSYVDPRVVRGYEKGMTIAAAARRAARTRDRDTAQAILEKATAALVRRVR